MSNFGTDLKVKWVNIPIVVDNLWVCLCLIKEKCSMENFKKRNLQAEDGDKDIVFSKSIKAGKRIYYLDVKKNRKDEMYLAITESKKIVSGEGENVQVNFEKHKIFLYQEDFSKFIAGLDEVVRFIVNEQGPCPSREEEGKVEAKDTEGETPINIDIEF